MNYEGKIYRPPSEAYSYILQVSIGCSHNQCTFCGMYKEKSFRMRRTEEIIEDLQKARTAHKHVEKIFLADGNALALPAPDLEIILLEIRSRFPECKSVSAYSAPKDILRKTVRELEKLKELGLKMCYLGVESGSDQVLQRINKGVDRQEMIRSGQKVKNSGIKLSVTVISGLGGKDLWQEHARESAKVINEIQPDYFALLTLLVQEETPLYEAVKNGEFQLLDPKEVLKETYWMIKDLSLNNTVFRSNHASNYVALKGSFPEDQEALLNTVNQALKEEESFYKNESYRRL